MMIRICFVAFLLLWPLTVCGQHDGARNAVRKIADGEFDQVETALKNEEKPFAGEAESAFVQMLSLLAQDQPAAALIKARAAVDAGLPFERLLAGPRSQLAKLNELPEFQAWQKELAPDVLVHGPMVGQVSDSGAAIWVRTSRAATVSVTGDFEAQPQTTTEESDFTTVVSLAGLQPSREYPYTVLIDDEKVAEGIVRTVPSPQTGGKFVVGFGGGAGYVPAKERIWDTILKFEPHAFLMLGDNVYIDQPKRSLTQQYCYYRRQSRPEWKRLTARTSIFSIWDDHDFGTDDCIPGPEIDSPKWKRRVWKTFRQNWVNPAYGGGRKQPGCWYEFHVGDVHFMMLDGRYYRDLDDGSMLGPVQKQWLLKTLSKSTATFKVIASPVPFSEGIKKGSRDPWDGFPEEREEIFRHIETERIEGVILVAADRHRTDLRTIKRANGYDLYEFESSRLTNVHTHDVVQTDGLLWGYNETCSFGLMSFDTTADDPQVEFQCVDIDGTIKESFSLRKSQLKFERR